MTISRREFTRLIAGGGAAAALGQLGRTASMAAVATSSYRAMVGVFLFGGNDAWNMVVPTDSRYATYASTRNAALVLPRASLMGLGSSGYGLHPSFAPLQAAWNEGALNVLLNTGSLFQPLTKSLYQTRPDLAPLNLMSHADEQAHWQGNRVRGVSLDGYMGRLADKMASPGISPLISVAGSNLITIGKSSSPLVLPSSGTIVRNGYVAGSTNTAIATRQAALDAFADGGAQGNVTRLTGAGISSAYAQAVTANGIVSATTSAVDQYFRNPTTGAALTSDISRQLLRAARMIEARDGLGHGRQTFFVSQGGYDTHSAQTDGPGSPTTGAQANLYSDLAMALAGFYAAMKAMGLSNNVTAFTMSDFGRVYKGNAQAGSDHAWGSNQLIIGGGLARSQVLGQHPNQTLGGPDDIASDGRWIPSVSIEEYLGSIALWHGVSTADMPYVFPNWSTWNGGGRGPVPFFG
jgi:uncharacterized protein (DUF1501 family)